MTKFRRKLNDWFSPFRALLFMFLVLTLIVCATDNDTSFAPGRLIVATVYGYDSCTTATANGEACIEGDIETQANLDVAGTATLTGTVGMAGAATVGTTLGVTGAETVGGTLTVTGQSYGPGGWELITTAETAAAPGDCNKIYASLTHLQTVLLPAVATANTGCCVTLINTAADGAAFVGFSINASDAVFGEIGNAGQDSAASGTDDEAFGNTKATAIKGDRVKLCSDGVTGWFIAEGMGIWASAAQ